MKLLIVDDEPAIREGIAGLINWPGEGFKSVVTACGAVEALEMLQQANYDLVLTDISMPEMNGIEFSQIVKQTYPFIKIVILTGYEKFEYAKKAIEIGVDNYLIKPIMPDELLAVLRKITAEIKEENKIKNWISLANQKINEYRPIVVERFWNDVLYGKISEEEEIDIQARMAEISYKHTEYCCVAFRLFYTDGTLVKGREITVSINIALQQICKEVFGKYEIYALKAEENLYLVVLSCVPSDKLLESLRRVISYNLCFKVSLGVGRACRNICELCNSAYESIEAVKMVHHYEEQLDIRYEDIAKWKKEHVRYPGRYEKEILDMLSYKDNYDVKPIKNFLSAIFINGVSAQTTRVFLSRLLGAVYSLAEEFSVTLLPDYVTTITRLGSCETFTESYKFTESLIKQIFEEKKKSYNSMVSLLVAQAKAIIHSEYADSTLSVTSIAKKLCITPNYLSRSFGKETGQSCIDYLNSIRLNKAREMLLESTLKSYEVAELVGYNNPNYFSAMFKRYFGCTPRDVRTGANGNDS